MGNFRKKYKLKKKALELKSTVSTKQNTLDGLSRSLEKAGKKVQLM